MLGAAATGEQLNFADGPFDLVAMKAWGRRRTVRASVLRHLLVEEEWPVHAKGAQLRGVRISGHLDLEAATLRCPLRLEHCYFSNPRPVNFDYAIASLLTLTRCHLTGLRGDTLTVTKEIELKGSTFTSHLRLPGADIAGQLNCRGAQLTGADGDGNALIADGMKAGSVLFDEEFTAAGTVRLIGADITNQLNCHRAQLTGADGNALLADGIRVSDSVFFDEEFTAAGTVRLPGADITGELNCRGAQLTGADGDGNALLADGIRVSDSVFFDEEFTAAGTVRLPGADITGQLTCSGAQLTRADGNALLADGIRVGGDMFLDEEFTAVGTLSLRSARVDGSLHLKPSGLADGKDQTAIDATGAQITHTLRWAPSRQVVGRVILEDAMVGELADDWAQDAGPVNGYWPPAHTGGLRLDGFTYTRTGGQHPAALAQRLAWIGSQQIPPLRHRVMPALRTPRAAWIAGQDRRVRRLARVRRCDFVTQPYEQLVKVYQQAGQDKEARKVAIARRRDLRRYGDLSRPRKLGNWLLDKSIQYGYQTWRAVAGIIVLYAAVLVFLWFARSHNAIVPVQITTGLHPAPTATSCSSQYPCFNPFGYAIDTVIPLINVHQADFWGPNESVPWGTVCAVITYLGTGFGWILATLAVAGYTGLVRKTDSP